MNKDEFITKLNDSLQSCSPEEAEKCVEYFCESIYDRMDDGMSEEEVIASMGDVNDLFNRMKSEMPDFFAADESIHVTITDGDESNREAAADDGDESIRVTVTADDNGFDANGSDANGSDANGSDDSDFYGYGYDGTVYYGKRNNQGSSAAEAGDGEKICFSDVFSVDADTIQQINIDLKNYEVHFRESYDNNIRISRNGESNTKTDLFVAYIENRCLFIQKNRGISKEGVKKSLTQLMKDFFVANDFDGDVQVTVEIPTVYHGEINAKLRGSDCTVADLTITDSRMSLQGMSGNISMERFQAVNSKVNFNMLSGDVYIKNSEFSLNCADNDNQNGLEIHTTSGDVLMTAVQADCKVAIQTVSGDCSIRQWSGTETMMLKTISGDARLSEAELGEVRIHTTSGDVNLNNGTVSVMRTETVSGDILLKLRGVAEDYLIETNTVTGDINIPAQNFNRQDSIMEPQKIYFKTVSGDIGVEFIRNF